MRSEHSAAKWGCSEGLAPDTVSLWTSSFLTGTSIIHLATGMLFFFLLGLPDTDMLRFASSSGKKKKPCHDKVV